MKLSEKVKYYRNLHGLSCRELAERIGYISKGAISDLESGRIKSLSDNRLQKLSKLFGVEFVNDILPPKPKRRLSDEVKNKRKHANKIIADKVKALISQGYTRKEVCSALGITNDKLRSIGYEYNLNFMHNAGGKAAFDWEHEATKIMELLDAGKTKHQIARHYEVSHPHICKMVRKYCPVEYWGCFWWSQNEIEALKKLYKAGEYRHDLKRSTDRRTGAYYAFQRYINKTSEKAAVNPLSGEDCHMAKHSNEFVDMIRAGLKSGKYRSIKQVADIHNMPYITAYQILTFKTYTRHLKVDQEQLRKLRNEMREVCKNRK